GQTLGKTHAKHKVTVARMKRSAIRGIRLPGFRFASSGLRNRADRPAAEPCYSAPTFRTHLPYCHASMIAIPRERLTPYIQLMRFDRPIGTLLLMWPMLWTLWIAGDGRPHWGVVIIFVLGTIIMRA